MFAGVDQGFVEVKNEQFAGAGNGFGLAGLLPQIRVQRLQIDQTLNRVQQVLLVQIPSRFASLGTGLRGGRLATLLQRVELAHTAVVVAVAAGGQLLRLLCEHSGDHSFGWHFREVNF